MLKQVSPDLPDVVESESTRPGDCSNVGSEGELVIHGNPKILVSSVHYNIQVDN